MLVQAGHATIAALMLLGSVRPGLAHELGEGVYYVGISTVAIPVCVELYRQIWEA